MIHYDSRMIFLAIFFGMMAFAEELNVDTLLQEALHQEKVMGNLKEALRIYQEASGKNIPKETQAKIKLRMAFCYEKMGLVTNAEELWNALIAQYPEMSEVVGIATSRVREHARRRQISQMKEDLQRLQDSSLRVKLENESEIVKLQERIRVLEIQNPKNEPQMIPAEKPDEPEKKPQETEQKIGDLLSIHLCNVAKNLYQKGVLVGAQENLKKALFFNSQNPEAKELLKEVEAMISHKESLTLVKKSPKEEIEQEERQPTEHERQIGPLPEEIHVPELGGESRFLENAYDFNGLLKKAGIDPKSEWASPENFMQFVQNKFSQEVWTPPASIKYKEGSVLVYHSEQVQEKIKNLWNGLLKEKEIWMASGALYSIPEEVLSTRPKLFFTLHPSGMFYTFIDPEQKEILHPSNANKLQEFKTNHFFRGEKLNLAFFEEVPLLQGYQKKTLHFQVYQEGLQIACQSHPEKNEIKAKIIVKRMNRPIKIVNTAVGPVQNPCWTNQQAELTVGSQEILIGGLVDSPQIKNRRDLFLWLKFQPVTIAQFFEFLQYSNTVSLKAGKYLAHYDVSILQNVKDIEWGIGSERTSPEKDRNSFILALFQRQVGPETPCTISQNSLAVYAPKSIHEKVKKTIDQLIQQMRTLCHFSIYMLCAERSSLNKLLENWDPSIKKGEGFQVHGIAYDKSKLMNQLKEFADIKFEQVFNSVAIGNTQSLCLKNCQLRSWADGINNNPGQGMEGSMIDVMEGSTVTLRPILFSENEGVLEITTAVYQVKGEQTIIYGLDQATNLFLKYPELNIQKGHARVPIKKGTFYILTGFKYSEMAPSKELFFLLVPTLMTGIPGYHVKGNKESKS